MTEPVPPRRRTRGPSSRGDAVTISQVARRANVSVATVSRALRGLPNVAPSTRSRIEQVARELDYQVDTYASRLATGRSNTIGLAVPIINTWYFSEVVSGAEAVLADAGFDVLLCSMANQTGRDRLLSEQTGLRRRLEGLVLVDVLLTRDEVRRLAGGRTPVVTVGQATEEFPSVTIDDAAAAATATHHLLDLGHERVGLITGSDGAAMAFDVAAKRRQGYCDALAARGVDHRPELEADGGFSIEGGAEAMVQLMTRARRPTAVFAISDEMALGALKVARDLGIRVPEDVSVIGFDDHHLAVVAGLTTVHQDPQWQGESAGRLLLGLDDDPEPETRHVVADTRLAIRATAGPAPVGNGDREGGGR